MDRRRTTRQRRGAIWLLVLALVSVLAPVIADSYVCPMAKAAREQVKSCCSVAEAIHANATPGRPQLEPPCDCPRLSWTTNVNDQVRELRTGSQNSLAMVPPPTVALTSRIVLSNLANRIDHQANRPSPPLWLRNQSILC